MSHGLTRINTDGNAADALPSVLIRVNPWPNLNQSRGCGFAAPGSVRVNPRLNTFTASAPFVRVQPWHLVLKDSKNHPLEFDFRCAEVDQQAHLDSRRFQLIEQLSFVRF